MGAEEVRNILQSTNRGGDKFWDFYSFNPPKSRDNWANLEVLEKRPDKIVIHTNYLDVPVEWLGEQFFVEAAELKKSKPMAYKHEYEGEPTGSGGNIFDNVVGRSITDADLKHLNYFYYGCDFGFSRDPFCWVKIAYKRKDKEIYILDEVFGLFKDNETITNEIKAKENNKDMVIFADSSEPRTINEMNRLGLRTIGAKKGKDSVKRGIKWLEGLNKIVIDDVKAPNTLREFLNYEYETDKWGNYISAYPDKNNHSIDAVRYALENKINEKEVTWA